MSQSPDPVAVSLYLHVPFCKTRCAYCDFSSSTDVATALPEDCIMWAIARDLGDGATLGDAFCVAVPLFLEEFVDRGVLSSVPSIYVGGGTPTVLGERLVSLVSQVVGMIGLQQGAEVTVEANPDSVTPELIAGLKGAGVTRVSLGVQSFDDDVLAVLGRCHSAEQAKRACDVLAASGLRYSVDLMCGVPGQTTESWRATVEAAIQTGTGHLSVYPLAIEDGTPIAKQIEAGLLEEPDSDVAAEHMLIASELASGAGFERYEVASYAKPGERARHNTGYWTGAPYLGVGPSASSMLPVGIALRTPMDHYVRTWPVDWRARFIINGTLGNFLGYLWDRQPATLEALTPQDALREDAMLGLRMSDGISNELAHEAAVVAELDALAAEGLVERFIAEDGQGTRWRTTERGWLLGNEVFARVWAHD